MLGVVASTGEKNPPIWFLVVYWTLGDDYMMVLKNNVVLLITKNMKNSNKATFVFQEDRAQAHTANIVQEWMGSNMNVWSKNLWPLRSQI
uniref:Uncharacterized protein n=1 Tax=Lepeophtheirus salmonis TaxID=72036 RepID=A0A0K2UZM1_LEPSM